MKTFIRYTLVSDLVKKDAVVDLDLALRKCAEHEVRSAGAGTPVASAISWVEHPPMETDEYTLPHMWTARVVVAVAT